MLVVAVAAQAEEPAARPNAERPNCCLKAEKKGKVCEKACCVAAAKEGKVCEPCLAKKHRAKKTRKPKVQEAPAAVQTPA